MSEQINNNPSIGRKNGKTTYSIKYIKNKIKNWQKSHPKEELNNRVIICLDSNYNNISPDNLEAITREELVCLNRMHGITNIPILTRINIDEVRLARKRRALIKNTIIEKEDKKEAQEKYQKSEKGKIASNKKSKKYWATHAADPVWRAEYNRKQRERRHREKRN